MNYGGNRCEGITESTKKNIGGQTITTTTGSQGVLDDGALRAEAKQDGAITMSFQYSDDKSDMMFKTATHTWRIAELFFDAEEYEMGDKGKLTMSDLDALKYPFDKRTAFPIHIYSDTDQAGVMIDVFWKANYGGTPQMKGEYPVNVSFIDPSNKRINI